MRIRRDLVQIWLLLVALLFVSRTARAQGTMTYVSSLSLTSTGSSTVGSDSWLAADFFTGTNASGYSLNSIQLGMADALGNPSNFMIMLYSAKITGEVVPGNNLGTLDGSLNPATRGFYTFTTVSNLMLSPRTDYFIVLTAGTSVVNGAYYWSESAYPPTVNIWGVGNGVIQSGDGTGGWSPTPYLGIAQFAINATAVPEPAELALAALGVSFLVLRRWKDPARRE